MIVFLWGGILFNALHWSLGRPCKALVVMRVYKCYEQCHPFGSLGLVWLNKVRTQGYDHYLSFAKLS